MVTRDVRTLVARSGAGLDGLVGDRAGGLPVVVVVLAVLAVVGAGLLAIRALARRRRRPRTGEIWFARVPFEEGRGSKDRPVLVLSVSGFRCRVAPFTSQDKSGRPDYRRVPAGIPGLTRSSWVSTRQVRLRRSALRRRTGSPGPALVSWYERSAG